MEPPPHPQAKNAKRSTCVMDWANPRHRTGLPPYSPHLSPGIKSSSKRADMMPHGARRASERGRNWQNQFVLSFSYTQRSAFRIPPFSSFLSHIMEKSWKEIHEAWCCVLKNDRKMGLCQYTELYPLSWTLNS